LDFHKISRRGRKFTGGVVRKFKPAASAEINYFDIQMLCLFKSRTGSIASLYLCVASRQADSAPAGSSKQQQVLLDSKTVLERVFVRTLSRAVAKQQYTQIIDLEIDCSKPYKVHD
jgi:hypothetical protein